MVSLIGLSKTYIEQQMADYRAGLRSSSEPLHGPANAMLAIGIAATPEEVASAAEYFSSIKPVPWIEVIETDTVPRTRVGGSMYIVREGVGTEAIGQRIIEVSQDLERTEVRDARSGFIAYAPVGSIAAGGALANTGGNGNTVACINCHGATLEGLGPVPRLAGRSPSYLIRQLHDFKTGTRHGLWSPLMAEAVAKLETAEIVALAAYAASLDP